LYEDHVEGNVNISWCFWTKRATFHQFRCKPQATSAKKKKKSFAGHAGF